MWAPVPPIRLTVRLRLAAALFTVALTSSGCLEGSNSAADGSSTTVETTSTTVVGQLTPIESVQSGQCFNEVGDETAQSFLVAVLACSDPHIFEVYDVQKFAGPQPSGAGADYPGDLVMANAAEAQCATGFEPFMGLAWEASDFEIRTWWPTQQSWNERKDRTILCAVYKVTGDFVVGTVRATKQ